MDIIPQSVDKLHFVVVCMGRLDLIKQTIDAAMAQPNTTYTIVDYSCPQGTGDWVEAHYPQARVVRVEGRGYWHASEARNIGAATVEDGWICFLDADILLHAEYSKTILSLVKPGFFLAPIPKDGICGMIVCAKDDFVKCGGYDENMIGWGWEDIDMRMSLDRVGAAYEELPEWLISHIDHDDALRSGLCDTADKMVSNEINRLYGLTKEYVIRNDEPHDARTLAELYRFCRERILAGYPWLCWPDPAKPPPAPDLGVKYMDIYFKIFVDVYRTLASIARGYRKITATKSGAVHSFLIDRDGKPPILELLSENNQHGISVRAPGRSTITVMSIIGATHTVPVVEGLASLELTVEPIFVLDGVEVASEGCL